MSNKTPLSKVKRILQTKEGEVLRLDIGCGNDKQPGFLSIDGRNLPGVDIVHPLEEYPYPIPDNSATVIKCVHVLEKINPLNHGMIKFMDEMWRMLKYDGQLVISVFYAGSSGYWADPCNVNGCTQQTWHYFDPLHPTHLYKQYKPKPWLAGQSYANPDGLMEIVMIKRREDPSYTK